MGMAITCLFQDAKLGSMDHYLFFPSWSTTCVVVDPGFMNLEGRVLEKT